MITIKENNIRVAIAVLVAMTGLLLYVEKMHIGDVKQEVAKCKIAEPEYTLEDWQQVWKEQEEYRATEPDRTDSMERYVEVTYLESVMLEPELQKWIGDYCREKHISNYLVLAIIEQESDYNQNTIGDSGQAYGLMQIQERWHKDRMDRLGVAELLDPKQNIMVGVDYLIELFQTGHEIDWVLMAYNGGMEYADKNIKNHTISNYAKQVIERAGELQEEIEKCVILRTDMENFSSVND